MAEMMKKYGHMEDVNEEVLRLCLADIESLKEQKKLFSEDLFRGIAMDFKSRSKDEKALCLHVAHTCNLNCSQAAIPEKHLWQSFIRPPGPKKRYSAAPWIPSIRR